jgi:hypothetical protein
MEVLWTETRRILWDEVFSDGARDCCAVFMVVMIEEEVKGGNKRLRVQVCEREGKEVRRGSLRRFRPTYRRN